MPHTPFRITATLLMELVSWMLKLGAWLWLVGACASCAPTRTGIQTVVTDSTTLRQVQRLVAVAVPGDSAKLSTRVVYDEATRRFQPVTVFTRSAHGLLSVSLDAFGQLTATTVTAPWVAQVPVTDTERIRSQASHRTVTKPVEVPKSGFVKFCQWFTVLVILVGLLCLYLKFFTPFRGF
jgi:hypothetical protein